MRLSGRESGRGKENKPPTDHHHGAVHEHQHSHCSSNETGNKGDATADNKSEAASEGVRAPESELTDSPPTINGKPVPTESRSQTEIFLTAVNDSPTDVWNVPGHQLAGRSRPVSAIERDYYSDFQHHRMAVWKQSTRPASSHPKMIRPTPPPPPQPPPSPTPNVEDTQEAMEHVLPFPQPLVSPSESTSNTNEPVVSLMPAPSCSPRPYRSFAFGRPSAKFWLGGGRDLFREQMRARPKSGHVPGWKEGLPESMAKPRPHSAAARLHRFYKSPRTNKPTGSVLKGTLLNDVADLPDREQQPPDSRRYSSQRSLYEEDPLPVAVDDNAFRLERWEEPEHWRLVKLPPTWDKVKDTTRFDGWKLFREGGTVLVLDHQREKESAHSVVLSATVWLQPPSGGPMLAVPLRDLVGRPGVRIMLHGRLQYSCAHRVEPGSSPETYSISLDPFLHRTEPYFPDIDPSLTRPDLRRPDRDAYIRPTEPRPKRALFAEQFKRSEALMKVFLLEKTLTMTGSNDSFRSACLKLDPLSNAPKQPCYNVTGDRHLRRSDVYFPQIDPSLTRPDLLPRPEDPYLVPKDPHLNRASFATDFSPLTTLTDAYSQTMPSSSPRIPPSPLPLCTYRITPPSPPNVPDLGLRTVVLHLCSEDLKTARERQRKGETKEKDDRRYFAPTSPEPTGSVTRREEKEAKEAEEKPTVVFEVDFDIGPEVSADATCAEPLAKQETRPTDIIPVLQRPEANIEPVLQRPWQKMGDRPEVKGFCRPNRPEPEVGFALDRLGFIPHPPEPDLKQIDQSTKTVGLASRLAEKRQRARSAVSEQQSATQSQQVSKENALRQLMVLGRSFHRPQVVTSTKDELDFLHDYGGDNCAFTDSLKQAHWGEDRVNVDVQRPSEEDQEREQKVGVSSEARGSSFNGPQALLHIAEPGTFAEGDYDVDVDKSELDLDKTYYDTDNVNYLLDKSEFDESDLDLRKADVGFATSEEWSSMVETNTTVSTTQPLDNDLFEIEVEVDVQNIGQHGSEHQDVFSAKPKTSPHSFYPEPQHVAEGDDIYKRVTSDEYIRRANSDDHPSRGHCVGLRLNVPCQQLDPYLGYVDGYNPYKYEDDIHSSSTTVTSDKSAYEANPVLTSKAKSGDDDSIMTSEVCQDDVHHRMTLEGGFSHRESSDEDVSYRVMPEEYM